MFLLADLIACCLQCFLAKAYCEEMFPGEASMLLRLALLHALGWKSLLSVTHPPLQTTASILILQTILCLASVMPEDTAWLVHLVGGGVR